MAPVFRIVHIGCQTDKAKRQDYDETKDEKKNRPRSPY